MEDTIIENFSNVNLAERAAAIDISDPNNVQEELVRFVNQIHGEVTNESQVQPMDPTVGQHSDWRPDPVSYIIVKWTLKILTLSAVFFVLSVSHNRFSMAEMRQFDASRTEGLISYLVS